MIPAIATELDLELSGNFDGAFLQALPNRLFGIMTNTTLIAVPLFVFMGVMLEKTRLAEGLLESLSSLLRRFRGEPSTCGGVESPTHVCGHFFQG